MALRIKEPKLFDYDYDGQCLEVPNLNQRSVCIFRWMLTKDGKKLKRSKSIKRITGHTKEDILDKAEKWIENNLEKGAGKCV
jgi:hypothetical protein